MTRGIFIKKRHTMLAETQRLGDWITLTGDFPCEMGQQRWAKCLEDYQKIGIDER